MTAWRSSTAELVQQVRAKDPSGAQDPNPAQLKWIVDTAKPTARIPTHPKQITHEKNGVFEVGFHPDAEAAPWVPGRLIALLIFVVPLRATD